MLYLYLLLVLLQSVSKKHCRNLKRVTKPSRQAPEKPATARGSCTDMSAAVDSAETATQDVVLRGRNAGLGGGEPVLAKYL